MVFLNGKLLQGESYRFDMAVEDRGVYPVLRVRGLKDGDVVDVYEVADVEHRTDIPVELLADGEEDG